MVKLIAIEIDGIDFIEVNKEMSEIELNKKVVQFLEKNHRHRRENVILYYLKKNELFGLKIFVNEKLEKNFFPYKTEKNKIDCNSEFLESNLLILISIIFK